MEVDTIITLNNNDNYLLLDETTVENRKIFFAVKLNNDMTEPTKSYTFIEKITHGDGEYAKKVEDKELIKFLATVFTNNYLDDVESGKYNENN